MDSVLKFDPAYVRSSGRNHPPKVPGIDIKKAVAFDTETGLIAPGLLAPPLVCASVATSDAEVLIHARSVEMEPYFRSVLQDCDPIFGHNIAYDMCVLMNEFPSLISDIFKAYAEDRVVDTGLIQKLVDISNGVMRIMESRAGYSLNAVGKRLLKQDRSDEKEGEDVWRKRYIELLDVPLRDWPQEAQKYAIDDAVETFECGVLQIKRWLPLLRNAPAQARAALALQLMMCWGVHTDPERVRRLKESAEAMFKVVGEELKQAGFVRPNGVRNVRFVQQHMVKVCREAGMRVKLTDTGLKRYEALVEASGERKSPMEMLPEADLVKFTSVDQDACQQSGDELLIKYGRYIQLQGVVNTHVPDLEKGIHTPIQARYNTLVDTGRTSCSKGKGGSLNGFQMQNPKRDLEYLPVGIRECFVSRPGTFFADCDFTGLELCTIAQVCTDLFGYSQMGEALNSGKDVHLVTASAILSCSYEEADRRKHEKEVKRARSLGKVAVFGGWGGLGVEGLVAFARGYGVSITPEESKELKQKLQEAYPENRDYFRWIRNQLAIDNDKELGALLSSLEDVDDETLEKYTIKIPTGTIEQLRVGRFRGRCKFTVAANGMFQGLGADGAKNALWEVARACYDYTQGSILLGARPCIFVHDQIVAEVQEEIAHEQAFELARVMVDACNVYLPDVPTKCTPALGKYWSKELEAVFDENGRLQPYDIAKEKKQKVFYPDGQPVQWKS